MSDTTEGAPATEVTTVNLTNEQALASFRQTGSVPGWVGDAHTVTVAPGEGGAGFVLTITGAAPIAPPPEPSPEG